MIATFCLRLALGLLATLCLLSPKQMHPRFFRTHFLTVLGLCVAALVTGWSPDWSERAIAGAVLLAFLGALAWTFEPPPAGWILLVLTMACVAAALASAGTPAVGA